MICTHQVMMFKLIATSIKQIHQSVHFTHHFCSGNVYHFGQYSFHGSKVSAVCAIIFSKSTVCNHQIFTGFYAYTKVKTIQWVFFSICFQKL